MANDRKRLFLNRKTNSRQKIEIIKWAATNNYDAIVFSLGEKFSENNEYIKLAKKYELIIEAGGHDLSILVPRKLFFFHREMFRMDHGRRKAFPHFCPTNPETTACITEQAKGLLELALPQVTSPRIFHLLPDEGKETVWCACPACRAFNPDEQYLIAVNSVADVLARLDPKARLSFLDFGMEPEARLEHAGITPRKNTLRMSKK